MQEDVIYFQASQSPERITSAIVAYEYPDCIYCSVFEEHSTNVALNVGSYGHGKLFNVISVHFRDF